MTLHSRSARSQGGLQSRRTTLIPVMRSPPFRAQVERPLGLRLIIAYKVLKALLELGLAVTLTLVPAKADVLSEHLAQELSDGGAFLRRIGEWLQSLGAGAIVADARALAWLDGLSTALEAVLLYRGKAWGEWLVIAGLAVLIPAEVLSLERRPSQVKVAVLVINAAIVAYLLVLRLRASRHRS